MKRSSRLAFIATFGLLLVVGSWLCASPAVHAQVNAGLGAVAPTIRLSSADPRVIAARIINVALGLLGIIFLGLVIYAGFLWMTSGGDSSNAEKARTLLRNAVIGLVIILSSWAITRYVISHLIDATTTGGGAVHDDGGAGAGGFGSGGGSFSGFQLSSISPSGSVAWRNVRVRFILTDLVDPATVTGAVHVVRVPDGAPVDGVVTVMGPVIEFVPTALCPPIAPTEHCFDADTEFKPVIDRTLRSLARPGVASQRIVCGGLAPACEGNFTTGNRIDTTPPTATILSPYYGQSIPQDDLIPISTRAVDDFAVSYVSSSVGGRDLGVDSPTSTVPVFLASIPWSTRGAATGTYALRSSAHDGDNHHSLSSDVSVVVRPAHCFNGRMDDDETGLDCGGSSCGRCASSSCTVPTDCRSGICARGVCVEQPVILHVSPDSGKPGTMVTIAGDNFGPHVGQVRFWDGAGFGAVAVAPTVCASGSTWTARQIIVEVPSTARTGPIQVTNVSSTLSDATNDTNGPVLDNFTVNLVGHPGICAVTPTVGERGDVMTLTGTDFGSTAGHVLFGERDVTPPSFATPWSMGSVGMNVPVITAGTYPVHVHVGEQDSNSVAFTVTEPVRGNPIIDSLDPSFGPVGEYVTIVGRNFGTAQGRVVFRNQRTGEQGNADIVFPAECSRDFWHETTVTVKVPPGIGLGGTSPVTPDAYKISLFRQVDGLESNKLDFTVNTATPRPGICSITPIGGPIGTTVVLSGERFGASADHLSFQGSVPDARVNATAISRWTPSAITAVVPSGSFTGPVRVTVGSASSSNGVNYAVRNCNEDTAMCGTETCCRDSGACSVGGVCASVAASSMYGWEVSTGQLPLYPEVIEECAGRGGLPPSPSPWDGRPGGSSVCVNAEVVIRFNTLMNRATLIPGNIVVSRCTGTGTNPCATKVTVPGRFEINDSDGTLTSRRTMVTFAPAPTSTGADEVWSASSTYDISLSTRVASQDGVSMRELTRCGTGMGYCFDFSTASSTVPCRIGSAGVTPSPFTAKDLGEQVTYLGNALSAGDQCIQINPVNLSWRWYTGASLSVGDSRAVLSAYHGSDCVAIPGRAPVLTSDGTLTSCPWRQTATAHNETGPTDPVHINTLAATPGDAPVVGTAPLYIQFVPPQVTAYGPNCNAACTEARIWAEFNVPMDPTFATTRQVLLYKCATENCRSFLPSTPLVLSSSRVRLVTAHGGTGALYNNRRVEIDPLSSADRSYLEPGAFYKVILIGDTDPSLRTGFRSVTGLALTSLNDRQGFAWRFRVKEDNRGICDVTRVDVTPIEKIETTVSARELFSADPVNVSPACGEQPLMSRGSYAWTSEHADVSKFINGSGDGLIDTNPILPANCSGRCLNLGSEGVDGHIASCGNRKVETTDATECRHRAAPATCTPSDSGCLCAPGDTDCVVRLDPSEECKVLAAGSQAGEECDLGDPDHGGLNGVSGSLCGADCLWAGVSAGTCGNGVVNAGEQCDPGKACVGGDHAGDVCSSDTACTGGGHCLVNIAGTGCTDHCLALGAGSVTTPGEDSQCGNHAVGAGETCDDGNISAGDGCSPQCLHEGSRLVMAVCGNTVLEAGESCERNSDGTWPVGCNHTSCLHQGTVACPALGGSGSRTGCCGNGVAEAGEDCDDNNHTSGDGCSSSCLAEGSSIAYQPHPSICGDGLTTVGEQCEVTRGDGATDGRQLSEIVGEREPDSTGLMTSRLQATYSAKTGEAQHGLQCGFHQERECLGDPSLGRHIEDYGLTGNGCCMVRPQVTRVRFPLPDANPVCRNTGIYFSFNQLMNEASVHDNFMIGEVVTTPTCPTGTQAVVPATTYPHVCVGGVTGTMNFERDGAGTRALFNLERALRPATTYRLIVRGDLDLTDATSTGARNLRGVVMAGDATWTFTTGDRICAANALAIRDTAVTHPYLFQTPSESHDFAASVMSSQAGVLVPISSIAEYGWSWQPWLSSETRVLTVGTAITDTAQQASTSTVQAHNRTGSSLIFAGIHVDRDTVNVPSTSGTVFETSHIATVSLCQRPWPAADTRYGGALLFSDSQARTGEASVLTGTIFEHGPYYNFATNYCMDGGSAATTTDDLPALTIRPTPPSTADASRGLLRQYLLTLDRSDVPAALRKDAIGIRVFDNPLHLSAHSWYTAQGFVGSPSSFAVDGYDAIQDGATVYVAAPNLLDSARGAVTSTIYLLSHNPDAQSQTNAIFKQLIDNWFFNANLQAESANVCKTAQNEVYLDNRHVVACSSDWECANNSDVLHCASFKAKIQRDGQRLADFQTYMTKLETARARDGHYPTIADGSYLQGITNSRWGSWQSVLGRALGEGLPIDPVNRFLTCGRCQYSGSTAVGEPCIDSSDCRAGGSCTGVPRTTGSVASYDPSTCWDVADRRFMCPRLAGRADAPSRFYQYRAIGGGVGYELGTELEAASYDRYQPPLLAGLHRCSNTGQLCTSDTQCVTYYSGTTRESSRGTCLATGGQWRYENVCTGREFGIDAVCGNGIRSSTEACEVGDTATASCTTSDGRPGMKQQTCGPACDGFIDGPSTHCVALAMCGNGRVDRYICDGGVKYGQSCSVPSATDHSTECSDPRDPSTTVVHCVSISSVARAGSEESCDDGVLNGTYGHCNRACTGYDENCGDGELSPGELCDAGPQNGQYCDTRPSESGRETCAVTSSCGFDCRSRAPFCGDGTVQTGDGEQCEPGQSTVTTDAVCSRGYYPEHGIRKSCQTDFDCFHGVSESGSCGHVVFSTDTRSPDGHYETDSCVGYTAQRCVGVGKLCIGNHRLCSDDSDCSGAGGGQCVSRTQVDCSVIHDCGLGGRCVAYATQRSRSCGPLSDDGTGHEAIQCQWGGWSSCLPAATCGDGVVNPGEECDDGNTNDNDACTSQCKRNVCGDGYLQVGAEQCDYGDPAHGGRNGAACSSEYGATCAVCTTSCRVETQSGGFCGNGRKDGREQCDFVGQCFGGTNPHGRCTNDAACPGGGVCLYDGVPVGTSCHSIGFDYANSALCNTYPYMTNPDGTLICVNSTGVTTDCHTCDLGSSDPSGYRVGVRMSGGDCRPCRGGDCVGHGAETAVHVTVDNQSACMPGTTLDLLSCSTSCGYAGCGSCLGAPSPGNAVTIQGDVYDQEANVPIPAARVVLTYRGNPVVDTVTDIHGHFVAPNLHGRRECGQYRLVVSSERDNPLTTAVESVGYRSFDSGIFSPVDFAARVTTGGRIDLHARTDTTDASTSGGGVLPGETRVLVTWSGQLPLMTVPGALGQHVREVVPHLILPASSAFIKVPDTFGGSYACPSPVTPMCNSLPTPSNVATLCEAGGRDLVHSGYLTCSTDARLACCPSDARDTTAILNYLNLYPSIPQTPATVAAYRAQACCNEALVPGSGGTVLGYTSAGSCGSTTPICTVTGATRGECCARDIGNAVSWQGISPLTIFPSAVATCQPHRITTSAYCDSLTAGTVTGVDPALQGPTGEVTQLACSDHISTCDEYVRQSTPTSAMTVRYLRSRRAGDVYQFYLEQEHYAERELGVSTGGSTGGVRCYSNRTDFARGAASFVSASCGTGIAREISCTATACSGSGLVFAGEPTIVCSGGIDTCTHLNDSAYGVQATITSDSGSGGGATFRSTLSTPAQFFHDDIALQVRILSGTDSIVVNPPSASTVPSCSTGGAPYLWHVFDQDAVTGAITVPNGGRGVFVCDPPAGMTGLRDTLLDTPYHVIGAPIANFPPPPL